MPSGADCACQSSDPVALVCFYDRLSTSFTPGLDFGWELVWFRIESWQCMSQSLPFSRHYQIVQQNMVKDERGRKNTC